MTQEQLERIYNDWTNGDETLNEIIDRENITVCDKCYNVVCTTLKLNGAPICRECLEGEIKCY